MRYKLYAIILFNKNVISLQEILNYSIIPYNNMGIYMNQGGGFLSQAMKGYKSHPARSTLILASDSGAWTRSGAKLKQDVSFERSESVV